jgi:hypothetical protein
MLKRTPVVDNQPYAEAAFIQQWFDQQDLKLDSV